VLLLRWTEEAIGDLVRILDYIEIRNPTAASQLHADILRTAENLPHHPHLYRPGRVAGTREALITPNYLMVYRSRTST
jgi:toxin ParE1/3/4